VLFLKEGAPEETAGPFHDDKYDDEALHEVPPHPPPLNPPPPWRQPRGKSMVSLDNSHTHATSIGWHLWEIDLRFAHGLPPGWFPITAPSRPSQGNPEQTRQDRSAAVAFLRECVEVEFFFSFPE